MKVFTLIAVLLLLPWRSEAAFTPERAARPPFAPSGVEGHLVSWSQVASRLTHEQADHFLAFNYDAPTVCSYDEAARACDYDATSRALAARRIQPVLSNDSRRFAWSQRGYDSDFGIFLSRDSIGASSYLQSPNGMGPWSYANLNPARYTDPTGRQVPDSREMEWIFSCQKSYPESADATRRCIGESHGPIALRASDVFGTWSQWKAALRGGKLKAYEELGWMSAPRIWPSDPAGVSCSAGVNCSL